MKIPISEPIDKLLDGGIEKGTITTFFGPSASGKTQISLCAAASVSNFGKVYFIDTEGSFSIERFLQISSKENLKRIFIKNIHTWEEQKYVVRQLEKEDPDIIIFDSFVALWRVEIDDENYKELNRELSRQLSVLSKIAREKNIPVVLTSQVYEDIETKNIEISSRNIIKFWSKNLIELIHAGKENHRIAIIRKSRYLPEGRKIEFKITRDGLKEVKFKLF